MQAILLSVLRRDLSRQEFPNQLEGLFAHVVLALRENPITLGERGRQSDCVQDSMRHVP